MELDKKKCRRAILNTLLYHSFFDFPLKSEEIWRFLPELRISQRRFKKILKEMIEKKIIFEKDNFYFLNGQEENIEKRKEKKVFSQRKIKIARRIIRIIRVIPWIKMIGLSGTMAMNNAGEDDDIDFLIITKKNRLWLTRMLLVLILELLGKRRKPKDKEVKDKICLNMFLDENCLVLPKEKRNFFTAHEICQLKPVLNKDKTYERFLEANRWVERYLPNSIKKDKREAWQREKKRKFWDIIFDMLEKWTFRMQWKYMEGKKRKEWVSESFAFFHPQDRAKQILEKYKKEKFKLEIC